MAKSKRNRRAKHKIDGASEGALIKADSGSESKIAIYRSGGVIAKRAALLSAELEAVIDIIARDRVYREMLAGRGRRLLMSPLAISEDKPSF